MVLIVPTHESMARLSWPGWLITYRDRSRAPLTEPEYGICGPVWNHLPTKTQIDQLEAIQRRALRIIYSYTNDMPYINVLYCAAIHSLADRREQLSCKFFKISPLQEPSSCLSSLLPNPRDPSITTRLRFTNKFPRLPSRTKISDIYFLCSVSLSNFITIQPSIWVFCSFFF